MEPIGGLKSHAEQGGEISFGKGGHVELNSNLASGSKSGYQIVTGREASSGAAPALSPSMLWRVKWLV